MGTKPLTITNDGGLSTVIGNTGTTLQDNSSVVGISNSFTDSSSTKFGENISISMSVSSGFPGICGQQISVTNTSNSGDGDGQCIGRSMLLTINGTQSYGSANFVGDIIQMVIGDVQSNSITDMYGQVIESPAFLGNAKPAENAGTLILNQGNVDIPYTAGLKIDAQTGSTENWGFDVDTRSRVSESIVIGNSDGNASLIGSVAVQNQDSSLTIGEEFTAGGADFKFGTQSQISTITTDASAPVGGILTNVENKGNPSDPLFNSTTVGHVLQAVANSAGNYSSVNFAGMVYIIASDTGQVGSIADSRHIIFLPPTWNGTKPSLHTGLEIYDQGSSGISTSRAIYISNQTGSDTALGILSDAKTVLRNDLTISSAGKIILGGAANGRIGRGTLVAGTVTISNTSVTDNTRIILTPDVTTAGATIGVVGEDVSSRVSGTSFTINSTLITDTNSFTYMLIEEEPEVEMMSMGLSEESTDPVSDFLEKIRIAIDKMKSPT